MWLAGMALPATPLLQHRLQYAIRAVACAVGAGVMLSAVVVAFLFAMYAYMVSIGINPVLAFLLPAVIGIATGATLLFFALRQVNAAAHLKDDLSLFPQTSRSPADPLKDIAERLAAGILPLSGKSSGIRDIAGAFMDGLMNGHPAPPKQERPTGMPEPKQAMDGNTEIRMKHGKGGTEFHIEKHGSLEEHPFL